MEKKKEQVIMKLNQIKEWANSVIKESRKMDKILESINKANPNIQDFTLFIDIDDARFGAESLIDNIDGAIDDIVREYKR